MRESERENKNMLFMKVFDAILLVYGAYTFYCGIQMKRTGRPSSWLIGAEEDTRKLDLEKMAVQLYVPTLLLGLICMIYGGVSTVNDFVVNITIITRVVMFFFLTYVLWYFAKLHKVKENSLK